MTKKYKLNSKEDPPWKLPKRDDHLVVKLDASRLTDREYFILMKRTYLDEEPLTLEEVGKLLGVSRQRIDQKMTRIFKKITFKKFNVA